MRKCLFCGSPLLKIQAVDKLVIDSIEGFRCINPSCNCLYDITNGTIDYSARCKPTQGVSACPA